MNLQYRAIEGTNNKTRRLAYLTTILLTLRQGGLSEQALLKKLTIWSSEHRTDLFNYYVSTGEITSTQKSSASSRYLDFAVKSNFIVPLSGMYQITRVGSVLAALMETYERKPNPFFLNTAEVLFYAYCLLKTDADILLTLADNLLTHEGFALAYLQHTFQANFLERLNTKLVSLQDEAVRLQLRDRIMKIKGWKHVERYAEHLVPPRLDWLLDLGLLDYRLFSRHRFELAQAGQFFLSSLPYLGVPSLHDVSDQWLNREYWEVAAKALLGLQLPVHLAKIEEKRQCGFMTTLLTEAFQVFRHSLVPMISLTQIMLYLSIRFLLDHHIVASPTVLTDWFLPARVLDGRQYGVRLSPRENESYLIIL